ncbi:PAS domain-containing protein [Chondromyces apiculatus]|uniref:RsbR, positive regulator of sigma-B n=1 Tax=Chondromyces apiculatus DSM 436 TaxID=1192034 RepID=A0A017TA73_9BACT|nr:PAS domain-containing protein [Chondromyces apiculatus]EYF06173.1 RsbR, positive regulator of sigma-B [Chondromyces apiculatus DSM 436]
MVDRLPGATLDVFFDTCPEMLFIVDTGSALQRMSAALRRWFGAGDDSTLSLALRVHPDDRAAFDSALDRLREGMEQEQVEVRFRDARGEYQPLSFHAARAADGGSLHGSLRAMRALPASATPAGQASPAEAPPRPVDVILRERSLILDTMAEYLPISIWAVDSEGTFVYHDGHASERAGVRRGQLLGQNVFALYAGNDGTEVFLRRALGGEIVHFNEELLGVHWETWIMPAKGEGKVPSMAIGFTLDVSKNEQIQAELRERLARIDQQQEIIRQLSTPIIEVWDGVLTLSPMFGILGP